MLFFRPRNQILSLASSLTILQLVNYVKGDHGLTSKRGTTYIYSPRITNWGDWGSWKFCYDGDYVVGVRKQIERAQGSGDDTGLNSIHLQCRSMSGRSSYQIQSLEGHFGDWTDWDYCNGVATGFELRSEPNQGGGDDAGAIDFTLLCGGPDAKHETSTSGILPWGSWSGVQKCPSGHAVCGFQTQVEAHHGRNVDDTALNNVDIACCKIENPAETCGGGTSQRWNTLTNCRGKEECKAVYRTGISYNGDTSGNTNSPEFYEHFGLGLDKAYRELANRFGDKLEGSKVSDVINQRLNDKVRVDTTFLDCGTEIQALELKCWFYTILTNIHRCKP